MLSMRMSVDLAAALTGFSENNGEESQVRSGLRGLGGLGGLDDETTKSGVIRGKDKASPGASRASRGLNIANMTPPRATADRMMESLINKFDCSDTEGEDEVILDYGMG